METTPDDVAAEVRAEAARRRLSSQDIAALLDVSPRTIRNKLAGTRPWRRPELYVLAHEWDLPTERLLPGGALADEPVQAGA